MLDQNTFDEIKLYSNVACMLDKEMITRLIEKIKRYLKNSKNYDINKIETFLDREINKIFILQRKNLSENQLIMKKKIKTRFKTLKKKINKSKKYKKKYNSVKNITIKNIINKVQDDNVKKYLNNLSNKDLKRYNISKNSSLDDIIKLIFKKTNKQIRLLGLN